MDKRLSFAMVLSASALAWVGCDDPPPPDGGMPCGGDSGVICLDGGAGDDAGPVDAGMDEEDAGDDTDDMCQGTARVGGRCRATMCSGDLTCFPELTQLGAGGAITLSVFDIPTAVEDPENPGEFLTAADFAPGDPETPEFPEVAIGFGPGGQCSNACTPEDFGTTAMEDTCPSCSTCSTTLGGSSAFAAVGITVRSFDGTDTNPSNSEPDPMTNDATPGICRADCVFNPEERGCQAGYTCDPSENICVEACVSDEQCNLEWGVARRHGLVAVVDGTATCNTSTGRCEWTPPSGAAFGSECESSADCAEDVGYCYAGRCTTLQCNLADASGGAAYPCPTDAICVGFGGNEAAFCLPTCSAPTDCFPGFACSPQSGLPGGATGLCVAVCETNAECRAEEACQTGVIADNPTIGFCEPRCDPAGTDCTAEEVCVQADGETYGFCEPLNAICSADEDCQPGEACEHLGADALGRCVPGCTTSADCTEAGEECRIQAGSTLGVCRAPGAACAPSPDVNEDGAADLPLRGDAQCIESQHCDSTSPETVGVCVDGAPVEPDAGMPDGGVDGGV